MKAGGAGSARAAGWSRLLARRRAARWGLLLVLGVFGLVSATPVAAQGGPVAPPFGGPVAGPPRPPASGPSGAAVAVSASASAPVGAAPTSVDEIAQMAEAVNAIRAEHGRFPLRLQPHLGVAAQRHAEVMAQSRTLSHTGAYGTRPSDRMAAAGYETCGGGENVAFGALQTVDDIARGWYESPSHRDLLLNGQVREMGIGRAQTPDGLVYWALELGQRPAVAPIVVNGEAAASQTGSVLVYIHPQVADYCLAPARRIVQVTLSNSPDFADAQSFTYGAAIPWTLAAGEGPRTVYARLTDESGRTVEAQDDILVSSTAPPPNTARNVSPPVETVSVAGPNGQPTQLTIYRTSYILPSEGALTAAPCGPASGPCWNVGGANLPALSNAAPAFPGAPNPAGRQLGALRRPPEPVLGPAGALPPPGVYGPAPGFAPPAYGAPSGSPAPLPGGYSTPSGNCPFTGQC